MDEKKALLSRLRDIWQTPEKRSKWIVILGLCGILLIFLSSLGGKLVQGGKGEETVRTEEQSASAYAAVMEESLTRLIGKISGAGKTEVLVTLQNDGETLYAQEERLDRENTQSGGETLSERESREENYVLIDGADGRSALVRTRMEPVVKGVVVVCEGGDDPVTASRIMEAVTTALAISSAKVCITKLA